MIRAFVGRNGAGKTAAMTFLMAVRSWQMDRQVVSNYRLFPERLGYDADLYRPLRSWTEIPRLGRHVQEDGNPRVTSDGELWSLTGNEGCTLLLDEITSVLPARDAVNVPPELQRMLNQFRKPDVWLGWTAPAWERADLMLREVTMDVTVCRPMWPLVTARRDPGSLWPSQRWFRWATYDAFDYEEASARQMWTAIRPLKVRRLWKPPERRRMFNAYDTKQGVELLDHIQCEECGGKFTRKTCRDPEGHAKVRAERRAAEDDDQAEAVELTAAG